VNRSGWLPKKEEWSRYKADVRGRLRRLSGRHEHPAAVQRKSAHFAGANRPSGHRGCAPVRMVGRGKHVPKRSE
jgi:hypothetical protein